MDPASPTLDGPSVDGQPPEGQTLAGSDEVDRLIAAWQRERPDLDVEPMQVLSRITRLARHLDRARRKAFSDHELDSWAFDVLAALRRAGEPYELSPGRLIRETLVTSGTMTNRVDRLELLGLVERLPDPGDRRGVRVRLTDRGRHAVDDALGDLLDQERQLLAVLTGPDRRQLGDLLRRVAAPIDG
jgi:DNA-binding MarR family transcriptional regulator